MKVNICGLTDMTIAFSVLGLILRGKIKATNIEIKNDEQMRELIGMKNAKLISIEDITPMAANPAIESLEAIKIVLEDFSLIDDELIDEAEKTANIDLKENIEEKGLPELMPEISSLPDLKNAPKFENNKKDTNSKKIIKKITKRESSETVDEASSDDGEVVIMTEGGARKGKGRRAIVKDAPESDSTKASIDALKKLEDEEAESIQDNVVNESSLPLEERMGSKATVAFGRKNAESIEMKNSILPEAEQIGKVETSKDLNSFILLEDNDYKQKEQIRIKNAFIDSENSNDNEDDNLIEH